MLGEYVVRSTPPPVVVLAKPCVIVAVFSCGASLHHDRPPTDLEVPAGNMRGSLRLPHTRCLAERKRG